jgi:hypothetical protein
MPILKSTLKICALFPAPYNERTAVANPELKSMHYIYKPEH